MNHISELHEPAPANNSGVQRPDMAWERLNLRISKRQREQIAEILLSLMDAGWGKMEIIVKDNHIKEFAVVQTVPAKSP